MSAPERIWICDHFGEYGPYFPEAVEAEGQYGGKAVSYISADLHEALKAENERLRERVAELQSCLIGIRDHRKLCHKYDDDVGHSRRDFDVEDVVLMEAKACAALKGDTDA